MNTSLIKATHSHSKMRDFAVRICRDYLSGAWKTITPEEIQLKRISGGLSNFLYYVSLPDGKIDNNNTLLSESPPKTTFNYSKRTRSNSYPSFSEPKEVLLRIYGQVHGESALETMLTESVVFTLLSERKLGPKLHGVFPGGRIEEFIPARALITSELSDKRISMKIAEKMSQIHSLDIPISKEPVWMFKTMQRWLKIIDELFNDAKSNENNQGNEEFEELRKVNFKEEVEWLQSLIESKNFPVNFSHNDLQEGNILYRARISPVASLSSFSDNGKMDMTQYSSGVSLSNENNDSFSNRSIESLESLNDNDSMMKANLTDDSIRMELELDPELMIIDFEYCAYNYRAFDIANHFLEWTFDYTNDQYPYFHHRKDQYPTAEQKDQFLSLYLQMMAVDHQEPSEEGKQQLADEVKCLTLASHLFWGLWAIANVHQEIEFGYWEYAYCRITEYFQAKNNYLKMETITGK